MRLNLRQVLLISAGLVLSAFQAEARTFKNAYISFEMLDTWKCKLEQTEFVCRSEDLQESKEAVIILTAKEKGPTDGFPIYTEHLSKPIAGTAKSGNMSSTVTIAPREVMINDQRWIDSLHINSEVQNYYTRYLATIKDQIAILVTLSAHNSKYQKHSGHFADTVKSLKVIASKDLAKGIDGIKSSDSQIFGPGNTFGGDGGPNEIANDNEAAEGGGGLFSNPAVVGISLLLLAAIAYVVLRLLKKK